MSRRLIHAIIAAAVVAGGAVAEESAPGHHGAMHNTHEAMGGNQGAQKLEAMPASGKAREAGYDGRYIMDATGATDDMPGRCAQASRGLVMLDNAGWQRCGGKSEGAAVHRSVEAAAEAQQAMHHH